MLNGGSYSDNLAAERAAISAFRSENRAATVAADTLGIAGTLPLGGAVGKVLGAAIKPIAGAFSALRNTPAVVTVAEMVADTAASASKSVVDAGSALAKNTDALVKTIAERIEAGETTSLTGRHAMRRSEMPGNKSAASKASIQENKNGFTTANSARDFSPEEIARMQESVPTVEHISATAEKAAAERTAADVAKEAAAKEAERTATERAAAEKVLPENSQEPFQAFSTEHIPGREAQFIDKLVDGIAPKTAAEAERNALKEQIKNVFEAPYRGWWNWRDRTFVRQVVDDFIAGEKGAAERMAKLLNQKLGINITPQKAKDLLARAEQTYKNAKEAAAAQYVRTVEKMPPESTTYSSRVKDLVNELDAGQKAQLTASRGQSAGNSGAGSQISNLIMNLGPKLGDGIKTILNPYATFGQRAVNGVVTGVLGLAATEVVILGTGAAGNQFASAWTSKADAVLKNSDVLVGADSTRRRLDNLRASIGSDVPLHPEARTSEPSSALSSNRPAQDPQAAAVRTFLDSYRPQ